ncbi:MAG: 30S ribosomal protein S3 [Candidatus Hydrothermarchaeales archaeon]
MGVERRIVSENIRKAKVKEFLTKELERAGCGGVDIQRTPMGTRVIIDAQRPGLVIGKRGASIRTLTDVLRDKYGLDNPQIEVNELEVPELNAQVMAKNVASLLERGFHFRRAAYTTLRRIMDAGAIGAEISISGKLTGDRSRSEKFVDGYIKHCGEPSELYVKKGIAVAAPKPGVIGVQVKIMPPGVKLPDDIRTFEEEKKGEEALKKLEREELEEELIAAHDPLDQTARAAIKEINATEFSEAELDALLDSEMGGKNRKTVIEALAKKKLQIAKKKEE